MQRTAADSVRCMRSVRELSASDSEESFATPLSKFEQAAGITWGAMYYEAFLNASSVLERGSNST